MLRVDQRGVGRLGGVIPLACRFLAAGILGSRDDFEIPVLQLLVNFLPAWQIEAATSPGCPGDHQGFPALEIGQVDDAALAVGHGEVRRLA